MKIEGVPYIDTSVEHVGVSKLRMLSAANLKKVDKTLVVQDANDTPLAVLLNYEQYLIIQNKFKSMMNTIDMLQNAQHATGLMSGARDAAEGRTVPFSSIRSNGKNTEQ
jgi:PHD/YefM family antitoxin component YafN of YafNO toxin-antitoxin module